MKWGQQCLMYPCWQNQIQFVVDVLLPNKILCYTTRLATTGKTKSTPLNMVIISTHPTCDPHFSSARRKPHTTILLIWSELKFEFLLNGFRKWKSFYCYEYLKYVSIRKIYWYSLSKNHFHMTNELLESQFIILLNQRLMEFILMLVLYFN